MSDHTHEWAEYEDLQGDTRINCIYCGATSPLEPPRRPRPTPRPITPRKAKALAQKLGTAPKKKTCHTPGCNEPRRNAKTYLCEFHYQVRKVSSADPNDFRIPKRRKSKKIR